MRNPFKRGTRAKHVPMFPLSLAFYKGYLLRAYECGSLSISEAWRDFPGILSLYFLFFKKTRHFSPQTSGRKKAHKHKLFALVNVQMALGQTAVCPRVNRAKKLMCSPRNTGNINFSLWLTGGLSQGCPDFQKVYVFEVYVLFSCPKTST